MYIKGHQHVVLLVLAFFYSIAAYSDIYGDFDDPYEYDQPSSIVGRSLAVEVSVSQVEPFVEGVIVDHACIEPPTSIRSDHSRIMPEIGVQVLLPNSYFGLFAQYKRDKQRYALASEPSATVFNDEVAQTNIGLIFYPWSGDEIKPFFKMGYVLAWHHLQDTSVPNLVLNRDRTQGYSYGGGLEGSLTSRFHWRVGVIKSSMGAMEVHDYVTQTLAEPPREIKYDDVSVKLSLIFYCG